MNNSGGSVLQNTLFLYLRMFVSLTISLFTSRVVLQTLGVADYGIYAVVGSVMGMFGIIQTSMIGATSRFLTFEMGKDDLQKLKDTFSTTLTIHIIIAVILFIVLETFGVWFLNTQLVIPQNRLLAANCIYQFSIFSTMLSVTQTPYNSCIVAHERFGFYAYMDILNTVLKLLILYVLLIGNIDKLILYGILTFIVSVSMMLVNRFYCIRQFPESHYMFIWKKEIFKPILLFSGWDAFGNISVMARGEGVAMLINIFFGPVLNASVGIANAVTSTVTGFSNDIKLAVRPQLIKDYATGDIRTMEKLMSEGTIFCFILQTILSVPLICEMHFVLFTWLGIVPESATEFTILSLLFSVFGCIGGIVMIIIHATGRIKATSIINGSIYILVIPITYISFRMGAPSWVPFLYNAITIAITTMIGIYLLHRYIPSFQAWKYFRDDVLKCLIMFTIITFFVLSLRLFLQEGWLRLCLSIIISVSVTLLYSYTWLVNEEMRALTVQIIKKKLTYILCKSRD